MSVCGILNIHVCTQSRFYVLARDDQRSSICLVQVHEPITPSLSRSMRQQTIVYSMTLDKVGAYDAQYWNYPFELHVIMLPAQAPLYVVPICLGRHC